MPIAVESQERGSRLPAFLGWLAAYFAAQIVLRSSAPAMVDIDEAEQLVMTQWWQWGYGHQPPLYTWLQIGVFEVIGRNVFALSLLKNTLIFLTYLITYAAGLTLLGDRVRGALAALGLLLLPQVAWSSQRDLTHSVLAMCMCAAVFWCFLLLMRRRRWWLHLALGATIGLGVLSKYNVMFLVIAVLAGGLFTQQGRAVLLRPAMLLSLGVAAAIVWPHGLWLAEHSSILASAAEKAKVSTSPSVFVTLGSLGLAMLSAVGPAIAVFVILFNPALRRRVETNALDYSGLAFALAATMIAVTIVVFLELPHFRARWLQPVVVVAPILLAAHLDPARLTSGRVRVYRLFCIAIAVCVLAFMSVRTIGSRLSGSHVDYVYPFERVAMELDSRVGGRPSVIVSDFALIAGNLKHQYPDVPVYVPGVRDDELVALARERGAVFVWGRIGRGRIPDALAALLSRIDTNRAGSWPVQEFTPDLTDDERAKVLAMVVLPPTESSATKPSSR